MLFFLFFVFELLFLFSLSQLLSRSLSIVFMRITHSQTITVNLLAFLFLPGVIIHELSHMLMASLLFVPVGEIEFLPQIRENTVKLGSVAVGQTDPFRRFFIGIAPLLSGITVIIIAFSYLSPFVHPFFSWQTGLLLYILFEIGNTMFSSKKDMEGTVIFFLLLAVISVLLWFFHIQLPVNTLSFLQNEKALSAIRTADIIFGITIFIDLFLYMISRGLQTTKKAKT